LWHAPPPNAIIMITAKVAVSNAEITKDKRRAVAHGGQLLTSYNVLLPYFCEMTLHNQNSDKINWIHWPELWNLIILYTVYSTQLKPSEPYSHVFHKIWRAHAFGKLSIRVRATVRVRIFRVSKNFKISF
jgi:hypothetical protein